MKAISYFPRPDSDLYSVPRSAIVEANVIRQINTRKVITDEIS